MIFPLAALFRWCISMIREKMFRSSGRVKRRIVCTAGKDWKPNSERNRE